MSGSNGSVSDSDISKFFASYSSDPKSLLATNAVCRNDVKEVLLDREQVVRCTDLAFNHKMKYEEAKVADQKATGRCWLFAATNVIRVRLIDQLKLVDNFELSQPFLFFWDKFEKCNYFLENIIKTRSEDVDSRIVHHLLESPVNDGGQYDMIINVIERHGLVPKSAYPESKHSCSSRTMNQFITAKLRQFAAELRDMHKKRDSEDALRAAKVTQLEIIYRIMCIFFGAPPSKFDWRFRTKKGDEYTEHLGLTPVKFAKELMNFDVSNMVSLISDPRNEYYRLYTVEYLGNVVGGRPVLYCNVPMEDLKKYTAMTIEKGEPVWFGCDVGKYFHRDLHTMNTKLLNHDLVFGTKLEQNRTDRLLYRQSLMTHAMTFVAFQGEVGNVTEWRVENSWGDKNNKGFASMTDEWFSEYMYQIVVDKNDLPPEIVSVFEQTPVVLPAWDPMGSLAGATPCQLDH